ncbi:MAG: amidohydrolase [Pseudomonadota bacterium]
MNHIHFLAFLILGLAAAPAGAAARQAADLIVEGDYVLTMVEGEDALRDGALAITDGRILAVGPRRAIAAAYRARRTIPGKGRVVMPGLINGHTHAAMTLFRGLADDLDLMTWLERYIFPMEGRFVDAAFVAAGTRLACWEMIRGGTTSFVDMYFYPDTIASVIEACGLRAIIAAPMIDYPSPGFAGWDDSLAAGIAFVTRWQGRTPRITPALGPHAPYTVSPEHLAQVAAAARRLQAPISIHLAEARAEIAAVGERAGTTPVRLLAQLGLLDQRVIAAHMVWPDEAEIALLGGKPVGVIHNPTSNLKVAAGIAPVPRLLAAGVAVGLGTDGAASNNDLNMWEEVRLAALLHKGVNGDPTLVPAATALVMATALGARAVGLGEAVGQLAPGRRADLIQLSLDDPAASPLYDIVSHLVYVANARDVVTSIVDGRVLMAEGKVLSVDGTKARDEARAIAKAIRAALAQP